MGHGRKHLLAIKMFFSTQGEIRKLAVGKKDNFPGQPLRLHRQLLPPGCTSLSRKCDSPFCTPGVLLQKDQWMHCSGMLFLRLLTRLEGRWVNTPYRENSMLSLFWTLHWHETNYFFSVGTNYNHWGSGNFGLGLIASQRPGPSWSFCFTYSILHWICYYLPVISKHS